MSSAESLPLAGTTVIVTRPSASATAQARIARRLGARVVRLPGIGLHAVEDVPRARAALAAARAADAWIFTSPAAVRHAFRVSPSLRPSPATRVFAVGAGTRRALARHAIAARSPAQGHDSESLLGLPELATPVGWSVALIDAAGGRDLIAPALQARGATVERIHVYARSAPRLGRRQFDALAAATPPWLTLLSSGEALEHLVRLVPPASLERWRGQMLIVSSARLAELAASHGFRDVRLARSALSRDLFEAATDAVRRHRL